MSDVVRVPTLAEYSRMSFAERARGWLRGPTVERVVVVHMHPDAIRADAAALLARIGPDPYAADHRAELLEDLW